MVEKPESQKNPTPSERKREVFERSLFLNSVFFSPDQTGVTDPMMKKILFNQEEPKVAANVGNVFGINWKENLANYYIVDDGLLEMFGYNSVDHDDAIQFLTTLTEIGFELQNWDNVNLFAWEIQQWFTQQNLFENNSEETDIDLREINEKILNYLKAIIEGMERSKDEIVYDNYEDLPDGEIVPEEKYSAFLGPVNNLNYDRLLLSSGLEYELDKSFEEFIKNLDMSDLPDTSDSTPLDDY